MTGFVFETVGRIAMGGGQSANLAAHVAGLAGVKSRAFLITDKGVQSAGLLAAPLASLHAAGIETMVFDGVCADPASAMVAAAAKAARAFVPDCIIGIGGGSSMDTAKVVAHLCASDQPLDALYGLNQAKGPRLPLILVPTTAGTGSEVTPISVLTRDNGEKAGIIAPILLPDLALIDPDLTLSLPRHITAATCIDALVHAIEALTSARLKNPISDGLALLALQNLYGALERACRPGEDPAARRRMMLGALQAGQAFANAPVGAIHALAYPLGGQFHISHGLSNALVMPHVMRFNIAKAAGVYAQIYDVLGLQGTQGETAKAHGLIDALERLCVSIGLERQLAQMGIARRDLPALADEAITIERLLINNPRRLNRDDALKIYEAAF